ncbi:hypothetical protein ABZ154_09380 [Streptomyces sp. NPDC006261]|uniref:hypothetical protein n=1 Tax=Streptomyces sp. NPDC006261 TaxID=3156739 RepID=UPI0033AF796E
MNDTEKRYRVATYSYACTAYVRTTLRRALELQSTQKVWTGTEYVYAAMALVPNTYVTTKLPDEQTWELTKLELHTIYRALGWRKGRRNGGHTDLNTSVEQCEEWSNIEEEIFRVLREVWHSEGKYWM